MEDNKFKIWIGIIVAFIITLVFGFAYYYNRGRGMWAVFKYLMIGIGVCILLGLIVYLVYLLFKQRQVDGIQLNFDKCLRACKGARPPHKQTLFFKGSEEWEYRRVGLITGLAQTTRYIKDGTELIKNKEGKETKKQKYKVEREDMISFKKISMPFLNWFEDEKIVRVTRNERSSLNADRVFLHAMAFSPELFGFLYLPSRYRDLNRTDDIAISEIRRNTLQEFLKEEINLVAEALAISPAHQKKLESNNTQMVQTVPQGQGGK